MVQSLELANNRVSYFMQSFKLRDVVDSIGVVTTQIAPRMGEAEVRPSVGPSTLGSRWRKILEHFVLHPERCCTRCMTDMHSLYKCPLWWAEVVREVGYIASP